MFLMLSARGDPSGPGGRIFFFFFFGGGGGGGVLLSVGIKNVKNYRDLELCLLQTVNMRFALMFS